MHDATDWSCLSLDQQVHMIGHQAVSIEEEWQSTLLNFKEGKKLLIVIRRVEDPASIVAARDHMIETAFDINSRFARHGTRMLKRGFHVVNASTLPRYLNDDGKQLGLA
jgi:hypothetical protein